MANVDDMVLQVRRIINDPIDVSDNEDTDIIEFLKDATYEVRIDIPTFKTFVISGSSITPEPDNIEATFLSYKASCLILRSDAIESAGDAILIRAGKISLDTSKSTKGIAQIANTVCETYNTMVDSFLINGVSGVSVSGGTRIDNYYEGDDIPSGVS